MNRFLKCAFRMVVMGLGLAPASAFAAGCNVYAFGDSLSDTGANSPYSAFTQSAGLEPPSAPPVAKPNPGEPLFPPTGFYSDGRYSNGRVWLEHFATAMCPSGTLTSFARGGAFSDDRNANEDLSIHGGLRIQVFEDLDDVLGNNGSFGADDVITVWAFSNNVVFDLKRVNPVQAVRDVSEAVQELAFRGARRILVINAPNIGDTPFGRFLSQQTFPGLFRNLNARVRQFNNMLRAAIKRHDGALDTSLALLDINKLFRAILINPGEFGFANASLPCMVQDENRIRILTGVCPVVSYEDALKLDARGTVFYDLLHPTAAVQSLIAAAALGAVPAAAPESVASAQ